MQNKNDLKTEVLLVSKYCSIIKQILSVHKQLSINKILLFAYLLKNSNNYYTPIYNAKTSNDIVIKAISQISGGYAEYCKNIKFIIEAIHLLIKNEDVILHDYVLLCKEDCVPDELHYNNFIKNAINESKNFSDRQFLKEVMNNV